VDVTISNPDKVFFPERGLTKGDLVDYYVDLAPQILNHVRKRPMQMLRWPDGVDGFSFYQKRVPQPHPDFVETVHVVFPSANEIDFAVVNNASALA
jgi:DNA primase